MKVPALKVFGYIALSAPVIFAVMWILSATIDGSWRFGVNSLSDMGISDNAISAFLFNFGCMITGIAGMIVGFGMIEYGRRTLKVGGAIYIVGMLFLSLVGVFTLDNHDAHYFVASTFSLVSGLGILVSSISDWKVSWYLYADIVLMAITVIVVIATPFETWEPIATITSMIWVLIMGFKMIGSEEKLFTDAPLVGGS